MPVFVDRTRVAYVSGQMPLILLLDVPDALDLPPLQTTAGQVAPCAGWTLTVSSPVCVLEGPANAGFLLQTAEWPSDDTPTVELRPTDPTPEPAETTPPRPIGRQFRRYGSRGKSSPASSGSAGLDPAGAGAVDVDTAEADADSPAQGAAARGVDPDDTAVVAYRTWVGGVAITAGAVVVAGESIEGITSVADVLDRPGLRGGFVPTAA